MPAVSTVLVVGGGAAGAATAILLADAGIDVEIAEIKPDVTALGSGITLQGNALRVLRQLGVWGQVQALGYGFDTLGLRAPDPHGTLLMEMPDARTGGPDLPATLGMYRPDLARILLDRAASAGARIRFGATLTDLRQDADQVRVTFAGGAESRYDLVVGADGVRSWTRGALGIDLETRATGMGIWRAFATRPASVTRTDLYYGGPAYIAGYCPTGEATLYAYLVEDARDRGALTPEQRLATMRALSEAYHGPWDDIRPHLTDASRINYTWFETHLLDAPWHRGRVVLIGDAVHACPPTLAQGAALALEDAAVLAELLLSHATVTDALLTEFTDRRHARAKTVVHASVQLGQWLLDRDRDADVPGLMGRVAALVGAPA
ncbi:2-polyprenyl-6-methoxyphenol hydroxylase-like FAD-dependent oxidoreductase [Catenuloplanes nepalensis]|uniref:2-polyprenyl-6-methoxyphenol hydroxylase-like FAD-dependent oxidoreductase n=1 Tax=Catenuloplanes nepalensis TaxID=587533 RepID=A0ABT9MNN3_9ACTN|nr:FAD-dependent monooxygenase [Catenuloplanes nepalensis]MDP9793002.1 2-polyprenyl-6-methoxyphenol hydroxylase-like FAD-dependent oxidoreductase [Catenuloplanes nepalensis]